MGLSAAIHRGPSAVARDTALGLRTRAPWLAAPALLVTGIAAAGTLAALAAGPHIPWLAWDTGAYWDALRSPHPYEGSRVGGLGAYLYSPVFLQVLLPLRILPWPVFLFGWTALNTTAAIVLLRMVPRRYLVLVPALAALATLDVWAGNINLLIALAMVLGLRRPAAWTFVLVTKVTPGIGLLWLVFKGRWFATALAVALTGAVVAVSISLSPTLWREWVALLLSQAQPGIYPQAVPLPAFLRFPLAAVLLLWAARTDRPWIVPIAGFLCLPVIWINGLAVLVGAAALLPDAPRPRVDQTAPAPRESASD